MVYKVTITYRVGNMSDALRTIQILENDETTIVDKAEIEKLGDA